MASSIIFDDTQALKDAIARENEKHLKLATEHRIFTEINAEMFRKHGQLANQMIAIITEGRINDDRRREAEAKYGEKKDTKLAWETKNNELIMAYKKAEREMSSIRDAASENGRMQEITRAKHMAVIDEIERLDTLLTLRHSGVSGRGTPSSSSSSSSSAQPRVYLTRTPGY